MQTANRRRTTWAVAASFLAHMAVLTVVALQHPMLAIREEEPGRPEPIIPILLTPRTPPTAKAGGPSEIRLHRRPQRFIPPNLPVKPLVTPKAPSPPPAAARLGPVTVSASLAAESQRNEVRAALQGLVGCSNPEAAGLTAAQRAKCDERLAAGAKDAPFTGLNMDSQKLKDLDVSATHKEACRAYRAGGPQPPLREGAC